MIRTLYPLGASVIARIDGEARPAEIRGHCHKDVDLYDVMTADDRAIHCYLRPEQIAPADAVIEASVPVLRIGSARR